MKDKLTSFGRTIRIFELDREYEENRMKIVEKLKEIKEEEFWFEECLYCTLRHKYLTKNLRKQYLNMSWDKKELTLNFNRYKTKEWKAFFTIEEMLELENKYRISKEFIVEPHTVWNRFNENGEIINFRF